MTKIMPNKIRLDIFFLKILIILVYFNPIADLFPSLVQIVVFVLWAISAIHQTSVWTYGLKLTWINIVIFVLSLIRCINADHMNMDYYSTLQVVISRYQVMIYPILFAYVCSLSPKEKRKIFKLAMFCIVGTSLVSLYYIFFVDPQAVRNTQRSIHLWGVGDFMLMYTIAILAGPLIFLIINRIKKKISSTFLIVGFCILMLCLVLCNLVTSVVVAILSIVFTYFVTKRKNSIYIFGGVLISLVVAFRDILSNLLRSLADKEIFYWSTNNKIYAIANVLSGDMTNIDTLSRRFMLAGWSIESFYKYPFFGINWKEHQYGTIGCHMQWADDLGRYGIVGNVVLWFNYIYIAIKTIKHEYVHEVTRNSIISGWIMLFILGFLNPCLSGTTLMLIFVIIPTFDSLVGGKNEKDFTN